MNAVPRNSEEKLTSIKQTQLENEYRGNINLMEEKRRRKSYSENRKGGNSSEFQQMEQNTHADNNDAKPYKSVINNVDMPKINIQRDDVKLNKNNHVLNNLPPLSTTTPRNIFNSNSRDREHRLGITQSPIPFTHNQAKYVEAAEIERAKQVQSTYADNKESRSRSNSYNINYGDRSNTTPSTTLSSNKIKENSNCKDANNGNINPRSDKVDHSKSTSSLSENAHISANRLPTHYNPMKSTSSESNAVCHGVNAKNNSHYVEIGKRYSSDSNTSGGNGIGLDNNNTISDINNKKNMFKVKRITPHSLTAQHNSRNEISVLESPIELTSSLHETHSNMKDLYSDADSMIDIGSLKSDTKEVSNTAQSCTSNYSHRSNTYSKGSKVNCFAYCPEQESDYSHILQKKLLVNNYIDHHHEDKDRVGSTRKSVNKATVSTFKSDQSSRGTSTATHCLTETSPTAHNQSISHVSTSCRANSDGFDIYSKSSKNNNISSNRDGSGMCTVNMENVQSKVQNANISKTESSLSVALQPHSRGNSGLVQSTWVESTLPKSPNVRCNEPEMIVAAASSSRSVQTPLANSGSRLSSPCYNRAMISTPTSISSSVNRVVSTGTRTPRTREPGSASTPRSLSFQRGNTLGSGGFGTVFQAILPDGTLAAVKELKLETNNTAAIDNEMRTMSSLPPHPNCVHYFGARYSKHHYYLIMEYISGGSIHSLRKTYGAFREPIFQSYAYMVLEGLYHLHQHGIIHRDIKGANVLLDEHGVAKIVDFGCCKDLNQGNTTLGGGGTPL